jgi:hypothetical protein
MMNRYDFTDFMGCDRETLSVQQVADAAGALSDLLNRLICVGHNRPEVVPAGEARFGSAQVELTKLSKQLDPSK